MIDLNNLTKDQIEMKRYLEQITPNKIIDKKANALKMAYKTGLKRGKEEAEKGMIKIEDVIKIIDDFGKLRIYRSKSCQLLSRRFKQSIKELGEKE